jgi:hypothetical protein
MGLLAEPDASSFDHQSLPVGSLYVGGNPCSSPLIVPRTSNGAAIFFRELPDHKKGLKSARGYHNYLEMLRSLREFDPEPWYSCFSLQVSSPFRLAKSDHGFPRSHFVAMAAPAFRWGIISAFISAPELAEARITIHTWPLACKIL